jgi:hypothetical protein
MLGARWLVALFITVMRATHQLMKTHAAQSPRLQYAPSKHPAPALNSSDNRKPFICATRLCATIRVDVPSMNSLVSSHLPRVRHPFRTYLADREIMKETSY